MNKIKIISNFTESKTYFRKMLKENYTWNNFQITDNKYADYYVIINEASKNVYFDKSKTINNKKILTIKNIRNFFFLYCTIVINIILQFQQ